jgi:hypothetical protein
MATKQGSLKATNAPPGSPGMRSNRGGGLKGANKDTNAYEESIYRAVMGPDFKIRDAYTGMLRELMIDPSDILEK